MKKSMIIFVMIAMFGWAIYDLLIQSDESNTTKISEEKLKEDDHTKDQPKAEVGLEVGNFAPDFELTTLDGKKAKLSDFRGERVMLNFWATWCPPCRAEMPDMEKFHKDTDVVILAVNMTKTESSMQGVKDFVKDFGLTFPILLDENLQVAASYQIRPIPTSFMIDSNGIIQYVSYGAMNYELMIQQFDQMK